MSVAWDDIGGLVDAHERFLAGARVDADVRDPVLDSWKRCRSAGLEPDRLLIPYDPDLTLTDPFLHAADPVLSRLTASLSNVSMTIVLCDGQARVVQRHGGDRRLLSRLDAVNFAPGFCASEAAAGTNGVGTALAERGPVYVLGREHFADCLSPFACAGAPVRDPLSGRIEAILDLTCLRDDGDPAMLRLVRETAHDIEARLLEQATDRERALLAAYRRAAPPSEPWPRQPDGPAGTRGPYGHGAETLGRVDLAVLREKAEELIASPHLTLDQVTLPGGRVATLLRRPVMGASGETGVVVEARVLGGPHLRHMERTAPTGAAERAGAAETGEAGEAGEKAEVGEARASTPPVPLVQLVTPTLTPPVSPPVTPTLTPPEPSVTPTGLTPSDEPVTPVGLRTPTVSPGSEMGPSSPTSPMPPPGSPPTSPTPPTAPVMPPGVAPPTPTTPTEEAAPIAPPDATTSTTSAAPTTPATASPPPSATTPTAPPPAAQPSRPAATPRPAVVLRAVAPPSPQPPPAAARPAPAPDPALSPGPGGDAAAGPSGDPVADAWLLLVGEPGVGRLAVLARRRLELLHDAGIRIGTTLDVTRTAEELTEVAVPRFADFAAVDLPDSVLLGDEPEPLGEGMALRRVALGAVHRDSHLYEAGDRVQYVATTPQARSWETGRSVLEPVLAEAGGWLAQDPARLERALAAGIHSLITVPLRARGTTLGVVSFYRSRQPAPFEDDDLSLAQELAGRAAICVDNARRYTREHNTALALQRSLLPRGRPEQSAVEVAYRYLPAQAGVGGDWFDVIPLSGARVALVVGDVVGHGLHAAATMGRLRTAVHNFSSLDLPPDDLLTHLDDLVARLDRGEGWAVENTHEDSGIIGATCLYAVYDSVSRHCTLARAGHPLPAIVGPGGHVDLVDLPSGPPLGLGGMPFETVELELAEGSRLVLYTDGLVEDRHRDIDTGLERLRAVLSGADRTPEDTCDAVLDALLPTRPCDDVALLVARTHALGAERVAHWELPGDPAIVSRARVAATRQLTAWGLDDLAFTTELIVSELVTNAIRHATGPVQLRLLRDRALICEVFDGSGTSPRLRRARTEDEGGRGLFLVAQLTERWGTRYTPDGKIIWAEQPLP
ncbi:SpoIIE family protein phosphatase [Streptomyces sp. JV178]|uniref:SpoIIE family protein phosphatase n=1 Tax=Streptomyces sp. JV178 TaxID=858632 RepID=UPI00211EB219|nr:SpoIIE family protein phosphatase [Streptomyces sp. JV178]